MTQTSPRQGFRSGRVRWLDLGGCNHGKASHHHVRAPVREQRVTKQRLAVSAALDTWTTLSAPRNSTGSCTTTARPSPWPPPTGFWHPWRMTAWSMPCATATARPSTAAAPSPPTTTTCCAATAGRPWKLRPRPWKLGRPDRRRTRFHGRPAHRGNFRPVPGVLRGMMRRRHRGGFINLPAFRRPLSPRPPRWPRFHPPGAFCECSRHG